MEKRTVLVTGIGGNVGQGIIRNIMALNYPIRIVGVNILDFSAGNHLVDAFYKVPYGYEKDYIPLMMDIVEKENVDLIIPSTDFETYYLSLNADSFNCKLAISGINATEKYLDKYLTWQAHKSDNIQFAESVLPSSYKNDYTMAIAKPRKGRGSKGIYKNVTNPELIKSLTDEEYMIQKMYTGREITTAVYVRYCDRKFHGLISMERTLENGATTFCKVVKEFDEQLKGIALRMIDSTDLKGSFNIQSIVNDGGEIYPFEINCRISGTNSIRAKFGFNDVKYTIDELLYDEFPESINVMEGFAYRFLSDVIYQNTENNLQGNRKDNHIIF